MTRIEWKAPWFDEEMEKVKGKSSKRGVKKAVERVRAHFTGKKRPVKREKVEVEGKPVVVQAATIEPSHYGERKRRAVARRE